MLRSFGLFLGLLLVALVATARPAAARTAPNLTAVSGGAAPYPAASAFTHAGARSVTLASHAAFLTVGDDKDDDKREDRDSGKGWDHDRNKSDDRDGDHDHDRDRDRRRNDHDRDDDHAPKPVPEPSTLLSFGVAVLVGGGVLLSRRLLGSRK